MIRAVMFDMGGTLEDIWVDEISRECAVRKTEEMLRQMDLWKDTGKTVEEQLDEGWKRYEADRERTGIEEKPEVIWCRYLFPELDRERLAPRAETFAAMWEVTHYHRVLRPGVQEMLQRLQGAGLQLGIISNTASLFQVFDSLEAYGIRQYFADVTLSSVTGYRKPDRRIFDIACRQLSCAPSCCAYVGDTVSRDITGAKNAGFALAIQIASRLTKEKDAVCPEGSAAPDALIHDIREVPGVIAAYPAQAHRTSAR